MLALRFGPLAALEMGGIVGGVEGLLRAVARAPVVCSFNIEACPRLSEPQDLPACLFRLPLRVRWGVEPDETVCFDLELSPEERVMAKNKFKVPKNVGGVKLPKSLRRSGMVRMFLNKRPRAFDPGRRDRGRSCSCGRRYGEAPSQRLANRSRRGDLPRLEPEGSFGQRGCGPRGSGNSRQRGDGSGPLHFPLYWR